jgi:hypothetical protein
MVIPVQPKFAMPLTSPLFITKEQGRKESLVHVQDRLSRRIEIDDIGITIHMIDQESPFRGGGRCVTESYMSSVDLFNGLVAMNPLESQFEVGSVDMYSESRELTFSDVFLVVEAQFAPVFVQWRKTGVVW